MQKRIIKFCLSLLAMAIAGYAITGYAIAESADRAAIQKSLQSLLPEFKADKISPSPIKGISEVMIGPQLFYVTNDGKYLFQGSLIDIKSRTDISEERRKTARLNAVNAMGDDRMIVFPASKPRHTITVFTDIDCGYCRKLHGEMDKYNAEGITVRYLMFPRAGIDSPSFKKAVTVWCSKDQLDAMTRSKSGENLPNASCDNPIKEEYELGQLLGVQGTPAIIMEDGAMLPGYVPAARLAKVLEAGS